jgi:hypothetical protein
MATSVMAIFMAILSQAGQMINGSLRAAEWLAAETLAVAQFAGRWNGILHVGQYTSALRLVVARPLKIMLQRAFSFAPRGGLSRAE